MKTLLGRLSIILAFATALVAALGVGCSTPSDPVAAATAGSAPAGPSALQEGDLISVVFPGATNLNSAQQIPYDGVVKIPLVGDFKAAGKTTSEVQTDILTAFGSNLVLKEVTVTLLRSAASVYISGAVLQPGKLLLDRPLTVMEAIVERGGFAPDARPEKTMVIRQEDGLQRSYRIDLRKMLRGHPTEPFYLKPSDVVVVPKKVINL